MRKDLPAPTARKLAAGPCREAAKLPDDVRTRLLHHLGVARAAVRTAGDDAAIAAARSRVQLAKRKDLPAPHHSQARGGACREADRPGG
jgi:hypothetical protein